MGADRLDRGWPDRDGLDREGLDREGLLDRYRDPVLSELPERARAGGWVVTADHCFGRIVLDNAVGGCWYPVLGRTGGPAFTRLGDHQLPRAVEIAQSVLAGGDPVLRLLDARSLAWRGKPARSGGASP